jgi:hypothetical protein
MIKAKHIMKRGEACDIIMGELRVPLVGLLPAFAFAKSQQPNQRGWSSSKAAAKSNFCVV